MKLHYEPKSKRTSHQCKKMGIKGIPMWLIYFTNRFVIFTKTLLIVPLA